MKKLLLLVTLFALTAVMTAQTQIPAGTVLAVELNTTLDAKNCKVGQVVRATVQQDSPLGNGTWIKAGTRVTGEVVRVTGAANDMPPQIALRFDKIEISGQSIPIMTNLRALASPLEVDAAQTEISGGDRGSTPPWAQTIPLVGGDDVVYREEGKVLSGDETVGKSVHAGNWGVLSQVAAYPGDNCRGAVAGNSEPQALWVFSHDACGAYGGEAVILQSGRRSPQGEIVLASAGGNLKVRSGSGLLLRVNGNGSDMMSQTEASE
jgi:hypothetical protein